MPPPIAPPIPGQAGRAAAGGSLFGMSGPGSQSFQPATAGYNFGLQNLSKAAQLSGQTTQGQQLALGNQLNQQLGGLNQSLTSRGLGNTTVANTMQQAPLQSYNLGMAQVGDLSAMRQMQAYQNLANYAGQGGSQISQFAQPYAQTNFTQDMIRKMTAGQPQYSPQLPTDFGGGQQPQMGAGQGQPLYQEPGMAGQGMTPYQNLLAAQSGIGYGQPGSQGAVSYAPQGQADQYLSDLNLASAIGANG